MSTARPAQRVEWIPLDRITIVNPRTRNKRVFKEIVDNIAQVGLKRPICGSAWKRDPVSGVIGVEKGPLILVF